jgi:hypothetical protein
MLHRRPAEECRRQPARWIMVSVFLLHSRDGEAFRPVGPVLFGKSFFTQRRKDVHKPFCCMCCAGVNTSAVSSTLPTRTGNLFGANRDDNLIPSPGQRLRSKQWRSRASYSLPIQVLVRAPTNNDGVEEGETLCYPRAQFDQWNISPQSCGNPGRQ